MNVKLLRRWGSALPGDTVDVDDVQGRWLVDNSFGTSNGVAAPSQAAAAPGADGPDPLAGGDSTRRFPATRKGSRDGNRASAVTGSPTQYTAGVASQQAPAQPEADEPPSGKHAGPSSKLSASGRKRSPDA